MALLLAVAAGAAWLGGRRPAPPAARGPGWLAAGAVHRHAQTGLEADRASGAPASSRSARPAGAGSAAAPPRRRTVGPASGHRTIGAALASASPGDTVVVGPGVYRERLVVRVPLVLIGEGEPVLDGSGEGHVIEALAPIELRGFVVRGSGSRVETEDAGLMVRDARAVVEGNRFEDVFYGIYLKGAPGSVLRGNRIEGKPLAPTRRGDGIRLWYSGGTLIEGNDVARTRDVVVYFSDSLEVRDNVIRDGRYALHYMYSHHNRFEGNVFVGNHVGAFIMYSTDIELRRNVFAQASGAMGIGLGLKDSEDVRAVGNLLARNAAGIHLDNSPRTRGVTNRFADNVLLGNGTAVRLLPSVSDNVFAGNDFAGNVRPLEILGGGGGEGFQNRWSGNHWSEYAGFDRDGDGVGDTPFVHARLADELMTRHPALRLYALSPAMEALEVLSRFFPLIRPQPVLVDSAPRLAAPELARWRERPPVTLVPAARGGGGGADRLPAAAGWAGLGALALAGAWAAARPRRPRGRRGPADGRPRAPDASGAGA